MLSLEEIKAKLQRMQASCEPSSEEKVEKTFAQPIPPKVEASLSVGDLPCQIASVQIRSDNLNPFGGSRAVREDGLSSADNRLTQEMMPENRETLTRTFELTG